MATNKVKTQTLTHVTHTFDPIYNKHSKVLILGSFPSVKSREGQFYYQHPQNRFWKVMSQNLNELLPISIDDKKELLLKHHIALWDVIESCDIYGSSDSSIKNVIANDIPYLLNKTNIETIAVNGGKAYQLYKKYCYPNTQIEAIKLPSTSPANASWSLEQLNKAWSYILKK